MSRPHMRIPLPILTVCMLASVSACNRGEPAGVQALLDRAPALSVEMARHLVLSDDSTLVRYVHKIGRDAAGEQFATMSNSLPSDSVEKFVAARDVLLEPMQRLADALAANFGIDYRIECKDLRTTPPEVWVRWLQLRDERIRLSADSSDPETKIERLYELHDEIVELGFQWRAGYVLGDIAEQLIALGRRDEAFDLYREALGVFRQADYDMMVCQTLGVLGVLYGVRDQPDSMLACWHEALRIAHAQRIALQAARLTSFFANYYASQGHLALANDLFNEAIDVCRRYGGRYHELRFIMAAMDHYADLEVWEAVGRMLPRARALDRDKVWRPQQRGTFDGYRAMLDVVEGRYLMASGRVREAKSYFEKAETEFDRLGRFDLQITMLLHWGEGLCANGETKAALRRIRDGGALARRARDETYISRFALARADAFLTLGDHPEVRRSLEGFETHAEGESSRDHRRWLHRDVIRIRLALAEADTVGAYSALAEAFDRIEQTLNETDASIQGYLLIGRFDELRQVAHDLVAEDAILGYGLEFYWRDLVLALGARRDSDETPKTQWARAGADAQTIIRRELHHRAESVLEIVRDDGALHCVYVIHGKAVWRWTATADVVRREALGVPVDALKKWIQQVTRAMAADPGDRDAPPSARLASALGDYASTLLPPEALRGGDRATLLLSTEGILAQLPFEALNISGGSAYEPLLKYADVAYLRRIDLRERSHGARGIVLMNAECNGPGFFDPPPLPKAMSEANVVQSLFGSSIRLEGESATKSNLMESMAGAPHIYMATHVVRDPEVPYLMHVQLSQPNSAANADAAMLDVADIRSTDLSACNIVVLSGCSSGAPYVGTHNWAPSLGDAFLDAGAGVAVQTFWDVKDEDAAALMTSFVETWRATLPSEALRSICDARRSALDGPHGARHPHSWAAFSINLGRL